MEDPTVMTDYYGIPNDQSWIVNANCWRHPDPDIFFPEEGRGNGPNRDDWPGHRALRLCNGDPSIGLPECPVRQTCGEYAIEQALHNPLVGRVYGIWGGLTERELNEAVTARRQDAHKEQRVPRKRHEACPVATANHREREGCQSIDCEMAYIRARSRHSELKRLGGAA